MKRLRRADLRGLDTPNWRKVIEGLGIDVLPSMLTRAFPQTIICTNCSGTKGIKIKEGIPKEFYLGKPQLRFYAFAEEHNVPYAILSDMYGIHFADEKLPLYDLGPSGVTDAGLWKLGDMIRDKCAARGIRYIVYSNSSPIMSKPYLIMLTASGMRCAYTTKLRAK